MWFCHKFTKPSSRRMRDALRLCPWVLCGWVARSLLKHKLACKAAVGGNPPSLLCQFNLLQYLLFWPQSNFIMEQIKWNCDCAQYQTTRARFTLDGASGLRCVPLACQWVLRRFAEAASVGLCRDTTLDASGVSRASGLDKQQKRRVPGGGPGTRFCSHSDPKPTTESVFAVLLQRRPGGVGLTAGCFPLRARRCTF